MGVRAARERDVETAVSALHAFSFCPLRRRREDAVVEDAGHLPALGHRRHRAEQRVAVAQCDAATWSGARAPRAAAASTSPPRRRPTAPRLEVEAGGATLVRGLDVAGSDGGAQGALVSRARRSSDVTSPLWQCAASTPTTTSSEIRSFPGVRSALLPASTIALGRPRFCVVLEALDDRLHGGLGLAEGGAVGEVEDDFEASRAAAVPQKVGAARCGGGDGGGARLGDPAAVSFWWPSSACGLGGGGISRPHRRLPREAAGGGAARPRARPPKARRRPTAQRFAPCDDGVAARRRLAGADAGAAEGRRLGAPGAPAAPRRPPLLRPRPPPPSSSCHAGASSIDLKPSELVRVLQLDEDVAAALRVLDVLRHRQPRQVAAVRRHAHERRVERRHVVDDGDDPLDHRRLARERPPTPFIVCFGELGRVVVHVAVAVDVDAGHRFHAVDHGWIRQAQRFQNRVCSRSRDHTFHADRGVKHRTSEDDGARDFRAGLSALFAEPRPAPPLAPRRRAGISDGACVAQA